jgi:transcriptional regulator with GAF, ATPase, and Fis domain
MMGGLSDSVTLSLGDKRRERERLAAIPYLVVGLECSRLAAVPSRHLLAGVKQVSIGRGSERQHLRNASVGTLEITVPDRWMSSRHVRLLEHFGRWVLEDAGSKNGTLHNGRLVERAELADGDLIEAGHTLFLFRSNAQVPEDAAADLVATPNGAVGLTTLSPALDQLLSQLRRLADAPIAVLLVGETGSGKEVLARATHELSGRSGDFVAVNCGAIPANLVESELFGYKKGAFSGAEDDRVGLIRAADGGTLFLDEIGDLPEASQAALLRVLQEREVTPVGGTQSVRVDVRVLSATHCDLRAMVEAGRFRRDLYARLAGFEVVVPPLRDRREDIGLLIRSLLGRRVDLESHRGVDVDAARLMFAHDWPLNIRELDNCLAAASALARDRRIGAEHLPDSVREPTAAAGQIDVPKPAPPLSAKDRAIRDQVVGHLRDNGGNVSATARAMGKDRKQIQRWLKRFAIDTDRFKSAE